MSEIDCTVDINSKLPSGQTVQKGVANKFASFGQSYIWSIEQFARASEPPCSRWSEFARCRKKDFAAVSSRDSSGAISDRLPAVSSAPLRD